MALGNEIGNIAKPVGADSWEVMDISIQDQKLNIVPCYPRPGFAFGGSRLPKDVHALNYKGSDLDLHLPLLNSLMLTNTHQIDRALEMVAATGMRRIAFLGLSFKAGTDALRESPAGGAFPTGQEEVLGGRYGNTKS